MRSSPAERCISATCPLRFRRSHASATSWNCWSGACPSARRSRFGRGSALSVRLIRWRRLGRHGRGVGFVAARRSGLRGLTRRARLWALRRICFGRGLRLLAAFSLLEDLLLILVLLLLLLLLLFRGLPAGDQILPPLQIDIAQERIAVIGPFQDLL